MTTTRAASFLLGLALLGIACGTPAGESATRDGDTAASEPASGAAAIEISNIAFKPETMNVLRGTTVTWTNMDEGVRHTATSGEPGERAVPGVQEGSEAKPDGTFDGDMPDAGATFSFTFDEAGTYPYFCEVHPSMQASITVE